MSTPPGEGRGLILAKRVKEAREDKGLSVAELAKIADVSKAYIHQIENGECPRPSAEVLFRIATSLGTSIAFLLGKESNTALLGNAAENEAVEIPDSLREFATSRPDVKPEEVQSMARMRRRGGQQQVSRGEWELLWISLKNTVWKDDD